MTETLDTVEIEKVNFRGVELKLKYTLYSLIMLEDEQGITLKDLQSDEDGSSSADFKQLVAVVWAGLITTYPDVTFEEVAQAFEVGDVKAISAEMSRAMGASTAVGKPAQSLGLA